MVDALDLLTSTEAKEAINRGQTNTDDASTLARHVTAVSRLIDERCGPVVRRTVTGELHRGGGCDVLLRQWPVASITTVREDQGGTVVTVPAVAFGGTTDGYRAEPLDTDPSLLSGRLVRYGGSWLGAWPCGPMAVEVTYVAGRYLTTASVDARFKDCAGAILRRLWKREAGTWAQSSDFFEQQDGQVTSGFFRVADPIIAEMLAAEQQMAPVMGQA